MVITGVAAKEPKRLAQLVYFDAYRPLEGEKSHIQISWLNSSFESLIINTI
jgi:hypothetical protein